MTTNIKTQQELAEIHLLEAAKEFEKMYEMRQMSLGLPGF